jgi:hypothetical protein
VPFSRSLRGCTARRRLLGAEPRTEMKVGASLRRILVHALPPWPSAIDHFPRATLHAQRRQGFVHATSAYQGRMMGRCLARFADCSP